MESGALSTDEFREFAKSVVLFAHVTTRIPGTSYDGLLTALGGKFYPTILFLDADGKVLGEHRWPRTVGAFGQTRAAVKRLLEIEALEKPSHADRVERLSLLGRLRRLDHYEAKEIRDGLGRLSPEDEKRLAPMLANLEAEEIMTPRPTTPEQSSEVGEELRAMVKDGRVPDDPLVLRPFWRYQLVHAEAAADVAAFETALAGTRKLVGDDPRWKKRLEKMQQTLERLRESEDEAR